LSLKTGAHLCRHTASDKIEGNLKKSDAKHLQDASGLGCMDRQ